MVELFARGLQIQERLTVQVADWLDTNVRPKGVGVVLEAEHLCIALRGVRSFGTRTVTSTVRGLLRDDPSSRQEFFALVREPEPTGPGDHTRPHPSRPVWQVPEKDVLPGGHA